MAIVVVAVVTLSCCILAATGRDMGQCCPIVTVVAPHHRLVTIRSGSARANKCENKVSRKRGIQKKTQRNPENEGVVEIEIEAIGEWKGIGDASGEHRHRKEIGKNLGGNGSLENPWVPAGTRTTGTGYARVGKRLPVPVPGKPVPATRAGFANPW
ncbi:hypothetical protein EDB85DRAFT_1893011 [Lactarius pseudohatsudake]|nr:hypothetical protein EDB85DRAFT_1893011 [Lactarius pseudohatsudake]